MTPSSTIEAPRAPRRRSPLTAVILSGIWPGLGQLYTGERLKALLFILGGVVAAFGPWNPLEVDIDLADPARGLRNILLASLPFLALVLWASVDAYLVARRGSSGAAH